MSRQISQQAKKRVPITHRKVEITRSLHPPPHSSKELRRQVQIGEDATCTQQGTAPPRVISLLGDGGSGEVGPARGGVEGTDLVLLPHGVALHLVHGRRHARNSQQVCQLLAGEVSYADGSCLADVEQLLHCRPRRRDDVLHTEADAFLHLQRPVDLMTQKSQISSAPHKNPPSESMAVAGGFRVKLSRRRQQEDRTEVKIVFGSGLRLAV
jgi:hypothetical protein